MRIFLSGGTHGSWHDEVMNVLPGHHFYDPRTLRHKPMFEVAHIEREWLDESDCVFFYFEKTNPSGLGSAFEVGYSVAKGVPVIFIDEKRTQHTEWLGIHCHKVVFSLGEGIEELVKFINEKGFHYAEARQE